MSTELGTYYVSLVPSAMNITSHAQRAFAPVQGIADRAGSESGGRFSGAFGRATSGLGNALGAALKVGTAAATAAVAAAGAVGVKTASQLETAQISFTTMLGSGEKAREFLGELKSFAAKTPFDLPGLNTAAKSLISIGLDSKKVIPIMTTLGNVTSGMGTGSEGIKRATVALQQMNAAQKISAEDLNQLRDAGIPVYELLTAATGKTTAQIAEMRDKGELGREELEALMTALETGRGFERFNGLMEAQSKSLDGLWSTLKDTFSVGMADIIAPLVPMIKDGLGGAITFLSDTVIPRGTAAMASFVAYMVETDGGFDRIFDSWTNLKAGFTGEPLVNEDILNIPFFYKAGTAIRWVGDAWQNIKAGFTGRPLVDADTFKIPFLVRAGEVFRDIAGWLGDVVVWAKQLDFRSVEQFYTSLHLEELRPALDSIFGSLQDLAPAAIKFGTALADATPDFLTAGVDLLAGALSFLADHVDWIVEHMPLIVGGFIAWRVAQMGVNIVTAASIPLMTAANIARAVAAVAELRLVAAQGAAVVTGRTLNTTESIGLVTRARATVATVAHNVATLASNSAARLAAAAQWLWNAALSANPIGIVIVAVSALTAAAVWFFTQTDIGRGIVQVAWALIKSAIEPVVTWFNDTAKPWINGFFGAISDGANGSKADTESGFAGITEAVSGATDFINNVAKPSWEWFFGAVGFAATDLWLNKIQPAFSGIASAITIAWIFISPLFYAFRDTLNNQVIPAVQWFEMETNRTFAAAGGAISYAWNSVILPVWNDFSAKVDEKLIRPMQNFGLIARIAWETMTGDLRRTWGDLQNGVFNPMGQVLNGLPGLWALATTMIGRAWDNIVAVAKAPITLVVNTVINKGVVDTFNNIAGKLPGVKPLERVKLPDGWARGGVLPGYRTTKSDDVLTPMRSGEGVLVPEAVRGIGPSTIHALNAAGNRGGVAAVHALLSNGLAFGGIVGDDDDDKRKGRRGKKPPPGAVLAGPGTPTFGKTSFGNQLQHDLFASRRLFVYNAGGVPGSYQLNKSANRWNGLANMEVIPIQGSNARGKTGGLVNVHGEPLASDVAGWYSGNRIALDSPGMGGNPDEVVAVHELGHALGLPHAQPWSPNGQGGGDGTYSVMNYDTMYKTGANPTAGDIRALRAIYPGVVKGPTQGREVSEEDGGGFNPFQGLIDGVAGLVSKVFPDGGMFVDAAIGTGKKALGDVAEWVLDKIGGFWDWLGGGGKGGPEPTGNVSSWAAEGLKRTGSFDAMNLASLTRRIMQESSGDPRAVNMWDSNASLGGTHGLMQLLKSNFNTYRDSKLSGDIYNPLANVVAGINYTKNRYNGNLRGGWDRPGGYALGGIVPTLFDKGGYLPKGPTFVSNEREHPEMILTDKQWSAMYDIADNVAAGNNRAPVYVQNPFTGDYLLARTEDNAVTATGDVLQGTLRRTRRGGKYAGARR